MARKCRFDDTIGECVKSRAAKWCQSVKFTISIQSDADEANKPRWVFSPSSQFPLTSGNELSTV